MKIPGLSVDYSDKLPRETRTEKNSLTTAKAAHSGGQVAVRRAEAQHTARPEQIRDAHTQAVHTQSAGLLKSLGLPVDRLSASIVSFTKFFSLPLDPAVLAGIRVLSLALPAGTAEEQAAEGGRAGGGSQPAKDAAPGEAAPSDRAGSAALLKSREALALAVLAAADKGVSLSLPAAREYVAAIDPDQQQEQRDDGQGRGQADSADERDYPGGKEQTGGRQAGDFEDSVARLKKHCIESARNNPVLDVLNRLPGKNGQRWMNFPLRFSEDGFLFRVTLRIFGDGGPGNAGPSYAGAVRRMSMDVVRTGQTTGGGSEQRWLFILDREKMPPDISSENGRPELDSQGLTAGKLCLTVLVQPAQSVSALKSMGRRVSDCMGVPMKISIRNFRDSEYAADCRNDVLLSINKEV